MKLSLNWIQDFVDLSGIDPQEIKTRLSLTTAEIEGIEILGGDFPGVLVAEVLTAAPHPNADRLRLTRVHTGTEEVSVVCGAPNVAAGQKIALATVGTVMPGGLKIKKAKIRGEESCGMICSEVELGLGEDSDGILVLPEDAPVGTAFGTYWGRDVVLDIDNKSITHRPDLWGLYGFARELAAIFERPLSPYPISDLELVERGEVAIEIADGLRCHRYLGALFDGIRVQPSPTWMQRRLEAVGVRAINNIVDLSNYVMMELGQPTHAFDVAKLASPRIIVRQARPGEKIVTLDGIERTLDERIQVIADDSGAIALAGVMGGEATEISEGTTSLLLEAACFDPIVTRRASGRLGLRSEAVARFEKDLDPDWSELAVRRFDQLARQLDPGVRLRTAVVDAWGRERPATRRIALRVSQVERKLGVSLPITEIARLLEGIAFQTEARDGELSVTVPSFRATKDVNHEDDLIEEVGRLFGYNNIPPQIPTGPVTPPTRDSVHEVTRRVQDILALAGGYHEVYDYSFASDELIAVCGLEDQPHLRLKNSIASNLSRLRRTLVPGLLGFLQKNLRFEREFRLFQVGRGYLPEHANDEGLPQETREVAGVWCRRATEPGEALFYRVKGTVEALLDELQIRADAVDQDLTGLPWLHPSRSAAVVTNGQPLGYLGELHPRLAHELDLEGEAALFVLNLRALAEAAGQGQSFREPARFPSSRLDISVIVPVTERVASLDHSIRQAAAPYVASVRLFDVYEGRQIPEGARSLSFEIEFQAEDRTLTEEEISGFQNGIVQALEQAHHAQLRG